jgi:hypothetical protein
VRPLSNVAYRLLCGSQMEGAMQSGDVAAGVGYAVDVAFVRFTGWA